MISKKLRVKLRFYVVRRIFQGNKSLAYNFQHFDVFTYPRDCLCVLKNPPSLTQCYDTLTADSGGGGHPIEAQRLAQGAPLCTYPPYSDSLRTAPRPLYPSLQHHHAHISKPLLISRRTRLALPRKSCRATLIVFSPVVVVYSHDPGSRSRVRADTIILMAVSVVVVSAVDSIIFAKL